MCYSFNVIPHYSINVISYTYVPNNYTTKMANAGERKKKQKPTDSKKTFGRLSYIRSKSKILILTYIHHIKHPKNFYMTFSS